MLANWKTTSAGAASIFTALGIIAHMVSNGHADPQQLGSAVIAVWTGIGLLFASDA